MLTLCKHLSVHAPQYRQKVNSLKEAKSLQMNWFQNSNRWHARSPSVQRTNQNSETRFAFGSRSVRLHLFQGPMKFGFIKNVNGPDLYHLIRN